MHGKLFYSVMFLALKLYLLSLDEITKYKLPGIVNSFISRVRRDILTYNDAGV